MSCVCVCVLPIQTAFIAQSQSHIRTNRVANKTLSTLPRSEFNIISCYWISVGYLFFCCLALDNNGFQLYKCLYRFKCQIDSYSLVRLNYISNIVYYRIRFDNGFSSWYVSYIWFARESSSNYVQSSIHPTRLHIWKCARNIERRIVYVLEVRMH